MKHTDVADYILLLTLIDFLHCVKHDNLQPELNKAILAMYKFMLLAVWYIAHSVDFILSL